MATVKDTICAVASPAGRGGVSIIRISGELSTTLGLSLTGKALVPKLAQTCQIKDSAGTLIDQGLVLYFKGPNSFTGEDVCELHTHGSPVVTDQILTTLISQGARLARPGEFSERAFLNDKIDLAQAEAIADLINSASITAAQLSVRSLQGEFSKLINELVAKLTGLRIYIEAALDFPEEEVDFLSQGGVSEKLSSLLAELEAVMQQAQQGSLIREGIRVAIVGEPNAGKSTLLNTLAGSKAAIVTDIPGTTRDILQQEINLDGLPIHILDTAGLRESTDIVEQEGIRRAWAAIDDADLVLVVVDAQQLSTLESSEAWIALNTKDQLKQKLLMVLNKIDITKLPAGEIDYKGNAAVAISAKQGTGIDVLRTKLRQAAGYIPQEEGSFIARRRHLSALEQAHSSIQAAISQMGSIMAGELVAEDLKQAQQALGEITGKVSSDELLGLIFSSFCIGK